MSSDKQDRLYLWYLADPKNPVLVGELRLVMNGRGVSLRYAPAWLQNGFALSEDLPLIDHEFLPRDRDLAAGSVDDARPDRWGERVIRHVIKPARLSILEFLLYAGDERFGALGVSTQSNHYQPASHEALPQLGDVDALHDLVDEVLRNMPVNEHKRRLLLPGTLGGARPKALITIDNEPWVIKFAEADSPHEPLIEHATMTLAAKAGINVAETRPIPLARGVALAVKRFDRIGNQRLHLLSAQVALSASGSDMSYAAMAQLLRRRGLADGIGQKQISELYRRMIFNILMDNTDDHEKNHAFIMTDSGHYSLSPAYDVLPAGLALRYQSMVVGPEGSVSTLENALAGAKAFGLSPSVAKQEIEIVKQTVQGWEAHFRDLSVPESETDRLSRFIQF